MLLAHKTNIKKLAIVLISSGLLAACNHTGSSSSSTSANATQHAAVNSVKEAQKILQVVNHSGSTIDHISLMSESGQVLFKSTTGLNCTNNQDCNVDLSGLTTTKKMLVKLYNNKNQVISMTVLMGTTVYANDTIFGAQLFSQFIAYQKSHKHAVNAMNLFQSLTKLFSNTKVNANVFEELGAYYSQQLTQGTIHNEDDFYTHLNNDLASGKPLTIKVPVTVTKQLLQTPRLGCDHAAADMATKILKTAAPFASAIPVFGSAISGAWNGWAAVAQDICPSEQFDIAGSFKEINEKLDNIQSSIDTLTNNVQELKDITTETTLNQLMTQMDSLYINENDKYANLYLSFLSSNKTKEGAVPLSLTQYVNSYDGLDHLDEKKYVALYKTLDNLPNEKLDLDKMNSSTRLAEITSAIKNICAKESGISGDIIAKRNYCNLITFNIGFKNAAYTKLARLRMSDKMAAILTMKEPEQRFIHPYPGTDWNGAEYAMRNDLVNDLNGIDKFYQNTLITSTAGLPEQLINSLNAAGNPLKCLNAESTPSGVNGLVEWHVNKNGKSLSDNDKYIVTSCYQDSALKSLVRASYHYAVDGSNVTNNLVGVLVNNTIQTRYETVGYKSHANGGWWGAINISDLKGVKINSIPYLLNSQVSKYATTFMAEYNVGTAKYPGNVNIQDFWVNDDGNNLSNETVRDWSRNNLPYWVGQIQGSEIIYNVWFIWPLNGTYTSTSTVPLALPITLNDGTTQWVTFGLYHSNSSTPKGRVDDQSRSYEYMGVQCLSKACNYWKDTDNDMSRIDIKLNDGRTVMISFKWNWTEHTVNLYPEKHPQIYMDII